RSFRDLGMGETAALSLSKGMRRGQGSPVNKSLKKPAREPWNERKGFMACAYFNGKKDIHVPRASVFTGLRQ
ncbi:MAG: hypothetical protein JSV55_01145, partial [Deltaproteobacteria bacterium]